MAVIESLLAICWSTLHTSSEVRNLLRMRRTNVHVHLLVSLIHNNDQISLQISRNKMRSNFRFSLRISVHKWAICIFFHSSSTQNKQRIYSEQGKNKAPSLLALTDKVRGSQGWALFWKCSAARFALHVLELQRCPSPLQRCAAVLKNTSAAAVAQKQKRCAAAVQKNAAKTLWKSLKIRFFFKNLGKKLQLLASFLAAAAQGLNGERCSAQRCV